MKIAVIGAGHWGKNLVRNFKELGVLSKVWDTDPERRSWLESELKADTASGLEEIWSDEEIDGVVVATPAETHFDLAKQALNSGKHVMVEKPLCLSLEQGEELRRLADSTGLTLMVGHLLEYHPGVLKLKELVDQGALGKLWYIYSNRLNLGRIRTEENILWSFAPHDISVILLLLGEMPDRVAAWGGAYLDDRVADVTVSTLSFPSGAKAHIHVSWLHPYKEQRLVVIGDRKMAVFDDVAQRELKLMLYDRGVDWVDRKPVPRSKDVTTVPFEASEPLRMECEHFIECVKSGDRPRTDAASGQRVLSLLTACQRSLESGGEPVDVSKLLDGGSDVFVHPTAVIDAGVNLGSGTKIWHFSHVLSGSSIGADCNIGQNCVIGPDVAIGRSCKIQNNVSVYKGVTLEDYVFCGPSMVFTNVNNPRSEIPRRHEFQPTLVKTGATLGANCTIICGNDIGRYAFVGSGAVVTRDVPDYALVTGNPARQQGWMCRCGVRLPEDDPGRCLSCGAAYRLVDGLLETVDSEKE